MLRKLTASLILLVMIGGPVIACCMVPKGFLGDVDQSEQQVLILHHDGHQEMVIRVAPYFHQGEDSPPYMAWVLTVPNQPTGYQIADQGVVEEAFWLRTRLVAMAKEQWENRTHFGFAPPETGVDSALGSDLADGLQVQPPVQVGPYTITAVKANGVEALDHLNAYLKSHGFPQEDPGHMEWFVENDFTFLCIYIVPPEGSSDLGRAVDLPPLQVGFETEHPYYPGMFSSQQGNFSLSMALITSKPLNRKIFFERKLQLNDNVEDRLPNIWSVAPFSDDRLREVANALSGHEDVDRWYVNTLQTEGFNRPDKEGVPAIAKWKEDIFFPLGDDGDAIPGWWYYGDMEIGAFEVFFRQHALAMMFWGGAIGLAILLVKSRFNRRRMRAKRPPELSGT